MEDHFFNDEKKELSFREESIRYLSFWPYFLILSVFLISFALIYIRYTNFTYVSKSIIEIVDESQNSEMALPTELTVFNRSMINLENEINILKSFNLNKKTVELLNSNINYYKKGLLKRSKLTANDWYSNYQLDFKIDTDDVKVKKSFQFRIENDKLTIISFDKEDNFINETSFKSLTTVNKTHNLPFDITIFPEEDNDLYELRELVMMPISAQAGIMRKILEIEAMGTDSDQLLLSIVTTNPTLAEEYLNGLIMVFDQDGINDRQLEYKRTIEFVNIRADILKSDLQVIELNKQLYKQENSVTNVSLDADNNIGLKYSYDSEIFRDESQKQIVNYLLELISDSQSDYLPINVGLENFDLNNMIEEHNKIVLQRDKYLNDAGNNNVLVKSLQSQIERYTKNITSSLENFLSTLDLKLKNLRLKENEFDIEYNRVPENEKTLRSIERELSIKEALYLLLLQKREEASINLAVVKPSIKIIDDARTELNSKSPNTLYILVSALILSIIIYFAALYLWFILDNKIHNKQQLSKFLSDEIPIIGEIPYIAKEQINANVNLSDNRSPLAESIRMLISNLKFTSPSFRDGDGSCLSLLFTSSVKGEGKTLVSINTALNLANDLEKGKKIILLGTDLRNPQIHKSFGVDKSQKGISEIIYNNDSDNFKTYIKTFQNLDVLFSGAIPPNPTSMLASKEFENLILRLKKEYDYVIIDSAPCILVSDTFQFINLIDSTVYIFRSSFTDQNIVNYINELHTSRKITNLNVVLNGVGNSTAYGYKYGYQYGYGYKYSYNYGYGYGYGSDSEDN